MQYFFELQNMKTGVVEVFDIYLDTYAEAEKYACDFARKLYGGPVPDGVGYKCISVEPKMDSPKVTPRFIYSLPGTELHIGSAIRKAVLFVNYSGVLGVSGDLPDWYYDEEKASADGRLKVEVKSEKIHDERRSDSLYVIQLDGVNLGWYIGMGREEEDTQDALVTNVAKTRELVAYLMSLKSADVLPTPYEYGLDEPVPHLYDYLVEWGVQVPETVK